jgi:ABC-type iron transport system FetAB permease component
MAVLSFIVALVLLGMWSSRIAAALSGDIQGVLLGQDTLDVQAFDLGLIVPLAIFTGVTVLRRMAVGYLLSTVLAVKAVTMAAAILAMLLSAAAAEGSLEIAPFGFFAAVVIAALWLAVRMFAALPGRGPEVV